MSISKVVLVKLSYLQVQFSLKDYVQLLLQSVFFRYEMGAVRISFSIDIDKEFSEDRLSTFRGQLLLEFCVLQRDESILRNAKRMEIF